MEGHMVNSSGKSTVELSQHKEMVNYDSDDPSLTMNVLNTISVNNSSSDYFTLAVKCLDFFNFYYLAVIVVLGMVGNTLNFLVFTQTHLRLRSSSYYLAALALADIGFLLTLLVVWLDHVGIDLFNRQGFCQATVYGSSVFSCLSVWLTVAFTFEIEIAMHIVNLVDTVVTLVIPLILILVMNALIAKNLYVFSRTFRKPPVAQHSIIAIQVRSSVIFSEWL